MKRFALDFARRGVCSCGIGPIVLAVLYFILKQRLDIQSLSVNEVCIGIFSLTALAFIAGGMNAIYQIERLPLTYAVLIHGWVLYFGYLGVYLLNDWLEWGKIPVLVFSAIFAVGYFAIWAVIYSIVKKSTKKINRVLMEKQMEKPHSAS